MGAAVVCEYHRVNGSFGRDPAISGAFYISQLFYENTGMCPPEWQKQEHITHQDVLDKLTELSNLKEVEA